MIRGGTEFSLKRAELEKVLTPGEWNHLALVIDQAGYSARLNGKIVAQMESGELANWGRKGQALLEIGNFDGYIDEVRITGSGE